MRLPASPYITKETVMAKQIIMKPHPFSQDAEKLMLILYRRTMESETKALRFILGDLFAEGYSEAQLIAAWNAFMASNPQTFSIRVFKAFMLRQYGASQGRMHEAATSTPVIGDAPW